MFKKTKLAALSAAILGVAGMQSASAVTLDSDGTGEVLVFPYYNVNNNFQTQYSIRNTSDYTVAVKVRFRESRFSLDVFDFNVYMSPFDIYTMTVFNKERTIETPDGPVDVNVAAVKTSDTTCSLPQVSADGDEFIIAYDRLVVEGNPVATFANTLEGYLEIIEMGIVTDNVVEAGVRHTSSGVPANCGVVAAAWASGAFTQGGALADTTTILNQTGETFPETYPDRVVNGYYAIGDNLGQARGMAPPSGALAGYSILLNVEDGAAYVADPAAIINYSTVAQHYLSNDEKFYLLPSLISGSDREANVIDNGARQMISNVWNFAIGGDPGFNDPSIFPRVDIPNGKNPYPFSNVLNAVALNNDWYTLNLGATDWVVTFPMRKYGIYNEIDDVRVDVAIWDREELPVVGAGPDFGFSPPPQGAAPDVLQDEVNIITWNNLQGSVLGSLNPHNIGLPGTHVDKAGWASLNLASNTSAVYDLTVRYPGSLASTTGDGHAFGIPVMGFAAIRGPFSSLDGSPKVAGEVVPHAFVRNNNLAPDPQ